VSADWATEFEENGFTVIRGVISREQIAHLRGVLEEAASAGKPHAIRNVLNRVPDVCRLAMGCGLVRLADEALEGSAFVIRGLFFDKTPDANWLVPWHQDLTIAVTERKDIAGFGPWSLKEGVTHVQPPEPWLSRRFAIRLHLDDCAEDNGPLRVLPGTHKLGRLSAGDIERFRVERCEQQALVAAGDALVMSPMLLHASSAAAVPGHRRVIHLEYAADPPPTGMDWYEFAPGCVNSIL